MRPSNPEQPKRHVRLLRRTVVIGDRETSIALEAEFWTQFDRWAFDMNTPPAELIRKIRGTTKGPLASVIRVAVLQRMQDLLSRSPGAATDIGEL